MMEGGGGGGDGGGRTHFVKEAAAVVQEARRSDRARGWRLLRGIDSYSGVLQATCGMCVRTKAKKRVREREIETW